MKGIFVCATVAAALLTGCQTTNWELSANCEGGSASWKCSGGGKISGTFKSNAAANFDASEFSIDLDGSTVGVPASGSVTISLVKSAGNSVQAASVFTWVKSGSRLYLSDPAQVNTWAQLNANDADSVEYQLHQFDVADVSIGDHMFSMTAEYAGVPRAVSISTFSRGGDGGCGVGHYCQVQ